MKSLHQTLKSFSEYICRLVDSGGPEAVEYDELNSRFQHVWPIFSDGRLDLSVSQYWPVFGEAFSVKTLQGFVVNKPHGYAGDFEIIDRIYTHWISEIPHLANWDRFFHWQQAPRAVRNRKSYFKNLLVQLAQEVDDQKMVLNVGCGPARDVSEYLYENPCSTLEIDSLDMDVKAIAYARSLVNQNGIRFTCKNAFRITCEKKYDLVWSAGLFDYLDEKQFIFLLRKLYQAARPGGRIVVGNFSDTNSSREYMEFGEWFLIHRSADRLFDIAKRAGYLPGSIHIDSDPTGVNLFLTISKM